MARYEIIDHGYMYPDYFSGCGTVGTSFTSVATGSGDSAKEAYEDAVDTIYQIEAATAAVDRLRLPKRPRGIRVRDQVPARYEDSVWYVSIRYSL